MKHNRGFTTVEVMITLFIAVALLGAGYQIFGVVQKNTADTQRRAVASNYAYEALRKYSASPPTACNAGSFAMPSYIPTDAPLPKNYSLTIDVACPFSGVNMSKITATVKYGTGTADEGEVAHALLIKN